jgi:hypothetical protein
MLSMTPSFPDKNSHTEKESKSNQFNRPNGQSMRLIKSYRSLENRVKNTKRSLPGKMSVLVIVLFVLFWSTYARSNDTSFDAPKLDLVAGEPVAPAPVDPSIRRALDQISTSRIEQTISRLVSFNNRNTLSSMEKDLPQGQGVSAAADWIETQFRQEAQACGGCLEVKRDTFTEQPQERITQPTTISNVYAILRGTDPSQTTMIRGTPTLRTPAIPRPEQMTMPVVSP